VAWTETDFHDDPLFSDSHRAARCAGRIHPLGARGLLGYRQDHVFEEIETAQGQAGNIRGSDCEIFAEIGEIFTGKKTIRGGATVIYDSVGVAILDVAAATLAYDLLTG